MEQHLLTIEELKTIGRPIGKVVDDKLYAFILEAEQLHVKPIIGDGLYLEMLSDIEKDEADRNPLFVKLLNGGTYHLSDYMSCDKRHDKTFLFAGLKKAIAYYVYAQMVMTGDFESTRYGMVIKDGDYSSHISDKSRSNYYNHMTDLANAYLKECVSFCKICGLIKTVGASRASVGGCTIKRIG